MRHKRKDYIGERYGRLVVTGMMGDDGKVPCVCDCGNEIRTTPSNLRFGGTKSCGCLKTDLAVSNKRRDMLRDAVKKDKVFGTSLGQLITKNKYVTNTSGHRGVHKVARSGKFTAFIGFRHKQYHLGTFDTIEQAISAREAAEEKFYQPIINMAKAQGLLA